MSTTEVRKEPRWEEGASARFSEKKSQSLILPRPPTGPLPPGSRHAAGVFVNTDSDQSESVYCARAPSRHGGSRCSRCPALGPRSEVLLEVLLSQKETFLWVRVTLG